MNVDMKRGVVFPNNPVTNVRTVATNNESVEARRKLKRTNNEKRENYKSILAGVNFPKISRPANMKETGNLTASLRGLNAHREAFLNQQQFLSEEMAKKALANHKAAEAMRVNNCKQQGGTRKHSGTRKRVSKIKRKARHQPSRKNVKGHRSR
jgi:hypothetical protein